MENFVSTKTGHFSVCCITTPIDNHVFSDIVVIEVTSTLNVHGYNHFQKWLGHMWFQDVSGHMLMLQNQKYYPPPPCPISHTFVRYIKMLITNQRGKEGEGNSRLKKLCVFGAAVTKSLFLCRRAHSWCHILV